jgi:hypothetical protein
VPGTIPIASIVANSATATGLEWQAPASGSFVGCSVYKSSTQSIADGSGTTVTYNAEYYDTDAFHDNSTNNSRITIPSGKGGKYLITVNLIIAANTTGVRIIGLLKNGDFTNGQQLLNVSAPSTGSGRLSGATVMDLAVSDYIEVQVFQNSSGSLDLEDTYSDNVFTATYLGA